MFIRQIHQSSFSHPAFSDSTECCSSFTFRFTSVPSFCSFCTSCCAWSRAVFNSPTCDSNCYQIMVKHKISVYKIVFSELNWTQNCLVVNTDMRQTLWRHSSCSIRCSEAIILSLHSFRLVSSCVHCSRFFLRLWACSSIFFCTLFNSYTRGEGAGQKGG